jgi:hypothetical protein
VLCSQVVVGDKVKLKSVIDSKLLGEGVVTGLWGDYFHCKKIEPPYVKVKVTQVFEPSA